MKPALCKCGGKLILTKSGWINYEVVRDEEGFVVEGEQVNENFGHDEVRCNKCHEIYSWFDLEECGPNELPDPKERWEERR